MIVWLNGTFGVGKTTTATQLVQFLPDARVFDSEYVGYMLRHVLVEQYWLELRTGLEKAGIPVRHLVLDADDETLVRRIEADTVEAGARQWRLDHLAAYRAALPWLRREAEVVDTAGVAPAELARSIGQKIMGD